MKGLSLFLIGILLGGGIVGYLDAPLIEELRIQLGEAQLRISKNAKLVQFCDDVVGAVYPLGTMRP